jgi:hypothetical protein
MYQYGVYSTGLATSRSLDTVVSHALHFRLFVIYYFIQSLIVMDLWIWSISSLR